MGRARFYRRSDRREVVVGEHKGRTPVFDGVTGRFGFSARRFHSNLVYALVPNRFGLREPINNNAHGLTRDGELVYLGADGLYHVADAGTAAIGKHGLFHDGAGTNGLHYSEDYTQWPLIAVELNTEITPIELGEFELHPFNTLSDGWGRIKSGIPQTSVSVPAGELLTFSCFLKMYESEGVAVEVQTTSGVRRVVYLDYINGTFSFDRTAGDDDTVLDYDSFSVESLDQADCYRLSVTYENTSSSSKDCLLNQYFFVTSSGKACTPALAIGGLQLSQRSFADSYIYTNGSAVSRATQAADAIDNGLSFAISTAVSDTLKDKFTILHKIRPEVDYDKLASGNYGIITFNDDATSGIYVDEAGNIAISDGTNTVSQSVQWNRADNIWIAATGEGSTLRIGTAVNGAAWNFVSGTFDGAIQYNTDIRWGFGLEYPWWLGPAKIYNTVLSNDAIESEASR